MEKRKVIAGNWKMNKTPSEAREFIDSLKVWANQVQDEVVICVPFVSISTAIEQTRGTNIKVGAQNMHWEDKGAYTGEISASMLKDIGVEYVIIGHSERRQYFGETDENVNKKVHTAFKNGLRPIVCVGESLEQREQGVTEDLVRYQVKIALSNLSLEQVKNIVIAYEPIWAIGTGKTATKEQANEVCGVIRDCILTLYGEDAANSVVIQYGGSVSADNANELFNMSEIDGGLVGGASLKPDFEKIARFNG